MPSVSTVNTIITEILKIFYPELNLILMQSEFHFTYYTPRGKTTKGTRSMHFKEHAENEIFLRHKKTVFLGTNDWTFHKCFPKWIFFLSLNRKTLFVNPFMVTNHAVFSVDVRSKRKQFRNCVDGKNANMVGKISMRCRVVNSVFKNFLISVNGFSDPTVCSWGENRSDGRYQFIVNPISPTQPVNQKNLHDYRNSL